MEHQFWVVFDAVAVPVLVFIITGIISFSMKTIIKKLNEAAEAREEARKAQIEHNKLSDKAQLASLSHTLCYLTQKFIEQGYCPIHEQHNISRLFEPYQELGGNGDIARDVRTCMKLPPQLEKEKK